MKINERRAITLTMPVPDGTIDVYDRRQASFVFPLLPPDIYMSVSSDLDLRGAFSASSPNWLLIPDGLNWQGDWSAGTTYDERDVVLYTVGTEPHAFVSKVSHNIGNIPPDKYAYWTRLVQPKWREK